MAKKDIKTYTVTIDSDCYAMSLVTDPAVEVDFVYLSKQKPRQVLLEDKEKHLIVGPALIPDKPIYRNQDGEEFYITFSRETIEQMAHRFISFGSVNSFTEQHQNFIGGISVVESWLTSGEGDKATKYGFDDLPEGTWMVMSKVSDVDLWDKIKSGEVKGYSIEAMVGLDEITLNKQNMAKDKNIKNEAVEITDGFWDKLRGIIADAMGKPQESKEVEDTVGEVADAIEEEGGSKDEKPKVVEAEEADKPAEEIADDAADAAEAAAETPEEEKENLQAVVDELEAKIKEKDAEIEQLKKENAKLSKQPSGKVTKKVAQAKQSPRDIIEALHNGTYFK